ncbi:hypothetical protein ACJX0J_042235 [Zea mays]
MVADSCTLVDQEDISNHVLREDFWEGRSELSIEEAIHLIRPFDEEEIKQAIDLMHSFLIGFPRNILEGVVILHEKAYDKVRWNFLAEWRMGKLLGVFFHYKMNSIRSNFFWQGAEKKKCYHMAKWEMVTRPKDQGGLGILDSRLMNECLLVKWIWKIVIWSMYRFMTDGGIIKDIYKNIWNGRDVEEVQFLIAFWFNFAGGIILDFMTPVCCLL